MNLEELTDDTVVGKMLLLLREGIGNFVIAELHRALGPDWLSKAQKKLPNTYKNKPIQEYDIAGLLSLIFAYWDDVFRRTPIGPDKTRVHELRRIRNEWAHQMRLSELDVFKTINYVETLVYACLSPDLPVPFEQIVQIDRLKKLYFLKRGEQAHRELQLEQANAAEYNQRRVQIIRNILEKRQKEIEREKEKEKEKEQGKLTPSPNNNNDLDDDDDIDVMQL